MKRIQKRFLVCILLALSLICCIFAACGSNVKLEFVSEGQKIESVEVKKGESYTEFPTPEAREGYRFEGWYESETFEGSPVTSVTPEKNTKYYAKWTQLYEITFDLGGGSLSDAGKLWLKAGENVYDAVQGLTPTKAHAEFGEWTVSGETLTAAQTMQEGGVTLTAKWKIEYSVSLKLQSLDDPAVYEDASEPLIRYAYPGDINPEDVEYEGFRVAADNDDKWTVGADYNNNKFELKMDRRSYQIRFESNYPEELGLTDASTSLDYPYGKEIALPDDLIAIRGYVLAGWTASDGTYYSTHYIASRTFNGEHAETPDTVTVTGRMTLEADWQKGYSDIFGGGDYIYIDEENKVAYLDRGDVFFEGEYLPASNEFYFYYDEDGDRTAVNGKTYSNGTFAYQNSRTTTTAHVYDLQNGPSDDEYFILSAEGYNDITYSYKDQGSTVSNTVGTYTINEDGYVVAIFTSGFYNGQTLTIRLLDYTDEDGVSRRAAQIRNEEEYQLVLQRRLISDGTIVASGSPTNPGDMLILSQNYYSYVLTGFGVALYLDGNGEASIRLYIREGNIFYFFDENGQQQVDAILLSDLDSPGAKHGYYYTYTSVLDTVFTGEGSAEGATIETDGAYRATYRTTEGSYTGNFSYEYSMISGILVRFTLDDGSKTLRFLLNRRSAPAVEGDDQPADPYVYYFTALPDDYAEYCYMDAEGVYNSPILVYGREAENEYVLYGRTAFGYIAVAKGTVTDDGKGNKLFTRTESLTTSAAGSNPVDLRTITSFVFNTTTYSTYDTMYWLSVTTGDGNTTEYEEKYTNGEQELTRYGSFAFYKDADGTIHSGIFYTQNGISILSAADGTFYFRLKDEDGQKTFEVLSGTIGYIYDYMGGEADGTVYLEFDGLGNATYTVVSVDAEGKTQVDKTVVGKVTSKEEPNNFRQSESEGDTILIYTFKSDEGQETLTFRYILLRDRSTGASYFARENGPTGTYTIDDETRLDELLLDGFGFNAKYTNDNGVEFIGTYTIEEENVILFRVSLTDANVYLYFDLKEGNKMTIRDGLAGGHYLVDNQGVNGEIVEANGYGEFDLVRYEDPAEEGGESVRKVIIAHGKYEATDDAWILTYTLGAENKTLIVRRSVLQVGNDAYNALIVLHAEIRYTFVNTEDWSVIELDGYGNATRYNKFGMSEVGSYIVIDDDSESGIHMFYYVNSEGTDAAVFDFDVEKGTVRRKSFTEKGYYSSDLKSLRFSKYGYMIENNGETRYYYNEIEGKVYVYHQDPENSLANKYGFVKEEFATLTSGDYPGTVNFEGVDYYFNEGYAVEFNRSGKEETYPITLVQKGTDDNGDATTTEIKIHLSSITFAPVGSETYSISAPVIFVDAEGKNYSYNGTLVRERIPDDTPEDLTDDEFDLYFTWSGFRFGLDFTYSYSDSDKKTNATFTVTSLKSVQGGPSNLYLTAFVQYLLMNGQAISNNFGELTYTTEFDEQGTATKTILDGEFGLNSRFFDSEGEIVNAVHAEDDEIKTDEQGNSYVDISWKEETYRLRFGFGYNQYVAYYLGAYVMGYTVTSFTRVQSFDVRSGTDTYTITTERLIASDNGSNAIFYDLPLIEKHLPDGSKETVELDSGVVMEGIYYFVARTYGEDDEAKTILSSTYYIVTLTEKAVPENLEYREYVKAPYESATLEVRNARTLYSLEGNYVDIVDGADGEDASIILFHYNGTTAAADSSKYDKETNTYTITSGTYTFSVVVTKDESGKETITITEVETSDEGDKG